MTLHLQRVAMRVGANAIEAVGTAGSCVVSNAQLAAYLAAHPAATAAGLQAQAAAWIGGSGITSTVDVYIQVTSVSPFLARITLTTPGALSSTPVGYTKAT